MAVAAAATGERAAPELEWRARSRGAVGYAFVLVPLGVFALFYLYPMVYAFYVSAHEWGGIEGKLGYVGLDNYRELLDDDAFWDWPPRARRRRCGTRSTTRCWSCPCRWRSG